MAQIIKHRRGSIATLKGTTARNGELIIASGSISDLGGPFVFVGSPNSVDEGVAGAFKAVSKIYAGATAPTIGAATYGSILDGTPFYASGNKSLYILNNDGAGGNSRIDLTGNIENNTISALTINRLNGNLGLNGDLLITGNTYQTGSITLTGDVTLRGNINIGDSLTGDTITLNSEISSSLIPKIHNTFDLGSSELNWRDLHVSGTAYVDTLQARQVNFNDLGVLTDLHVSGSTYLGNGGDILVVSGSAYYDTLTNNRVVIAGINGLLEDDENFTFNGTELNIGQGNFTVQQGSGNLLTKGTAAIESTLTVTGATELKSTLVVSGATTIDDTLNVTGNSTLEGSLTVTGATELKSTLVVSGATTIDDTLNVTGNSTLEGSLTVTGTTSLKNTLTVTGTTTIHGNETVNGVLTVTGNTQLGGNLYVSGNLEVLGSSTSVTIQSQTVEIDDNIIRMNAYSPFLRYAGFEVNDSGSVGVSGSVLWDSLNDYWMFVSASGQSSKMVGTTAGTFGSEVSLTNNTIPKATGANNIGNSLLTDNGTTLAYNTNKFTITASDGATLIAGNVTLSSAGGADANSKTSAVVFKNSSNVLGYVSTTETTDVLDGILGYKNSNGGLVFSTVIDGGTY
jgi:predicted acyltransferase (DUF342 family)